MKNISSIIIWFAMISSFILMKYSGIKISENDLYRDIYLKYSDGFVNANLLRAVSIVESNENANAFNPNDPSYGLMQILHTGSNIFYIVGWPPGSSEMLYNPDYNVNLGSQILKWNIKKYGFLRGIVCYNNWSARRGTIPMKSWDYFFRVYVTYLRLGGNIQNEIY